MYLELVKKRCTVLPVYTAWLVLSNFDKPKRFVKVFSCAYNFRLGGFIVLLPWRKMIGLSKFFFGVVDIMLFFDISYFSSYMFFVIDLGCFIDSFYRFGILCAHCLYVL